MSKIGKKLGKDPIWMRDITQSWEKDKDKSQNEEPKGLPPTKSGKKTNVRNVELSGPLKYMQTSTSGGGFSFSGSGQKKSPSSTEKKRKRKGLFSGWKSGGNKNDFFTRFFTPKSRGEKDLKDVQKISSAMDDNKKEDNEKSEKSSEDESNTQMRSHIVKFMNNQLKKSLREDKPVMDQLKERSDPIEISGRSTAEKEHLFGPPNKKKMGYGTIRMAKLEDFQVDPQTPSLTGPSSFGKELSRSPPLGQSPPDNIGIMHHKTKTRIEKSEKTNNNVKKGIHDRSVTSVENKRRFVDNRDKSRKEQKKHHVSFSINYNIFDEKKSIVNTELVNEMKKKRKTQLLQSFSSMRNKIMSKITKKKKGLQALKNKSKKSQLIKVFKNASEYKKALKEYLKKLQSVRRSCDNLIDEIERNQTYIKKQIKKHLDAFRKKNLLKLIEHYRSYTIFKLMRLNERRNLEIECRKIISGRIFFTSQALKVAEATPSSNETSNILNVNIPPYITPAFFAEIDKILLAHPSLNEKWNNIKALDKFEGGFYKKFTFQKKVGGRMKSKKEMEIFLKDKIIQKTYNFYKQNTLEFIHQDSVMKNIKMILGDRRTSIGKSINGFLREITSLGMQNIPADEYTSYIESLVNCLTSAFSIPPKSVERHILLQLTSKYIFNLIGFKLYEICHGKKKNNTKDKIYHERLQLLQNLSPIQIGVPIKFLNANDPAGSFQNAIDFLRYIEFCNDPNDMLHCIATSSSSIGHEARMSCNANGCKWEFGADDFFPILVYTIVKSNIPNINAILDFVSKYAVLYKKESSTSSEITYFKTCFEGAVMYVSEMTVKQLRTLLQEKNEKLVLKDFDVYECSYEKFEEMEVVLEEATEMCIEMVDCCEIKPRDEEEVKLEEERKKLKLKEKERLEKEEQELDRKLESGGMKKNVESVWDGEKSLFHANNVEKEDDEDDFIISYTDEYEDELIHSYLSHVQVDLIKRVLKKD